MKKVLLFWILGVMMGLSAYAQQRFSEAEARRFFDEKFQMVFGDEGSSLHYAVNIIGVYKTEGTIWLKQGKSKSVDSKVTVWNNGITYTRADRSKRKVDIYDISDDERAKFGSRFSFNPDNFTYAVTEDKGQYVIALKAKKGVKGIKEAKCFINKATGYPEAVRIKLFIFSTTIKITNFQAGNIPDDTFVFPQQDYQDYTYTDHRE